VFKLLFFRIKDRGDLERLVAVRGARLDRAYVRRWMVDMMGEDDERVRAWDDIVERFAPDAPRDPQPGSPGVDPPVLSSDVMCRRAHDEGAACCSGPKLVAYTFSFASAADPESIAELGEIRERQAVVDRLRDHAPNVSGALEQRAVRIGSTNPLRAESPYTPFCESRCSEPVE